MKRRMFLALAPLAACAHLRGEPAGVLRIVCNVPDATLRVDDVLLGQVSTWAEGRGVRAGFHRVEISHPNYFPFFAEIQLEDSETEVITAELRPQLD